MKYKVGDKVKIINKFCGHNFKIGEEVIVKTVDDTYKNYAVKNGTEEWNVIEEEIREVAQPQQDNKFNYWRNICEIQAEQTAKGLSKYGYPLEQNTWLDINERLRYLQEELVDALMYIEHIKTLLNEGENDESI